MFILDSLFVSGLRWVLDTVATAAEAEMNDDTVLREELLAAEMRREMGEISDERFAEIEADLLARIREIKERREGGSGPIAFGAGETTAGGSELQVEATVSGDFHEPPSSAGTVIETTAVAARDEPSAGASPRARAPGRRRSPSRRSAAARTRRS